MLLIDLTLISKTFICYLRIISRADDKKTIKPRDPPEHNALQSADSNSSVQIYKM